MAAEARHIMSADVTDDALDEELETRERAVFEVSALLTANALQAHCLRARLEELLDGTQELRRRKRRKELIAPLREVRFFGIVEAD